MSARGPALARCEACNHGIWRPEYASRTPPLGEKCGGRIRKTRARTHAATNGVTHGRVRTSRVEAAGQMDLFEEAVTG